jgi:hypothetical protein
MFRFFRKLRQRLLTENKVSRYLLYAFGEIFLIVIGILLALYLNNIMAEKQARELEIKLLRELQVNLESNIAIFERSLASERQYLSFNKLILEYLDNRKPYDSEVLDEAFGVYFWTITTNPVTSGYDYLNSKGIDIITNDSLRKRISFIFESEFSILKNENEVWSNNLQQNISYPSHVKRFRRYYPIENEDEDIEFAKPFNYSGLLEDDEFKSINSEIISNRKWNINSLLMLTAEIKELIPDIEQEIRSGSNS